MGADYTMSAPVLSPLDCIFMFLDVIFFFFFFGVLKQRRLSSTLAPRLKKSVHGYGGCEPGIKVPWRLVSGESSLVDGHLLSRPHMAFFLTSYSSSHNGQCSCSPKK